MKPLKQLLILETQETQQGRLMIFYIKWGSTILVLIGILLTNLNIYPLNIFIHGAGAVGWTIAGYLTSDRALLTNFGLQIPLFMTGYLNILI